MRPCPGCHGELFVERIGRTGKHPGLLIDWCPACNTTYDHRADVIEWPRESADRR